jgi:hypothetical protein
MYQSNPAFVVRDLHVFLSLALGRETYDIHEDMWLISICGYTGYGSEAGIDLNKEFSMCSRVYVSEKER